MFRGMHRVKERALLNSGCPNFPKSGSCNPSTNSLSHQRQSRSVGASETSNGCDVARVAKTENHSSTTQSFLKELKQPLLTWWQIQAPAWSGKDTVRILMTCSFRDDSKPWVKTDQRWVWETWMQGEEVSLQPSVHESNVRARHWLCHHLFVCLLLCFVCFGFGFNLFLSFFFLIETWLSL